MKKEDIEKKINKMADTLTEELGISVTAVIHFNDWAKCGKNRTYINVTFVTHEGKFAYEAGFINNETKRYNKGNGINLNGAGDFSCALDEMRSKLCAEAVEDVETIEIAENVEAAETTEEIIYTKGRKAYIIKKGKGEFKEPTNNRYRPYKFVIKEAWRAIIRENGKETLISGDYYKERWEAIMEMGYCFEEVGIPLTQEMKNLGCFD